MMFVIFILAALMGATLLGAALVVWLWEVAMPLHWALLVVSVAWCVVATIIYRCSLGASLERLRSSLDVVYKVSTALDMVYNRVVAFVERVFKGI